MARKRVKAVKAKKPARAKDLVLGTARSRGVKGGRPPIQLKTPAPAGPVPLPYPN